MYYIYHIPGVKIGCTNQPKKRFKFYSSEPVILEEHTDIYAASERELQLQKEYSLPVDSVPYYRKKFLHLTRTEESFKKQSKSMSGSNHPAYGKTIYREVSSGVEGPLLDMCNIFKITGQGIQLFAKRNKPISRGPRKGLHFQIASY